MESYVQQRLEQIADKWARVRARVADSYAISYKAKLIHRENNILNGGYKACQQERLAAHQHWAAGLTAYESERRNRRLEYEKKHAIGPKAIRTRALREAWQDGIPSNLVAIDFEHGGARDVILPEHLDCLTCQVGNAKCDRAAVTCTTCLDGEKSCAGYSTITQIGVATLDCSMLESVTPGSDVQDIIVTANYDRKGWNYANHLREMPITRSKWDGKHLEERRKHFIFGKSQSIDPLEMANLLNSVFKRNCNDEEKIIVVGHSLETEFWLMRQLGVDLELPGESKQINTKKYPSVIGVLDTQDIPLSILGQAPNKPEKAHLAAIESKAAQWGLRDLCERLGIPTYRFHMAGNDANCTLKAVLMLAIHNAEKSRLSDSKQEERINILKKIAKAAIADRVTEMYTSSGHFQRMATERISRGSKICQQGLDRTQGPKAQKIMEEKIRRRLEKKTEDFSDIEWCSIFNEL